MCFPSGRVRALEGMDRWKAPKAACFHKFLCWYPEDMLQILAESNLCLLQSEVPVPVFAVVCL